MKKQLLLGLSTLLLLTACSGAPKDSVAPGSSVAGSDTASSSELPVSSAPIDSAAMLNRFITKLANKKQVMSMQIDNGAEDVFTFVGEGGYALTSNGKTTGSVKNSQGWFNYSIENNAIVLGDFVSFDTTASVYDDFCYTGLDFAALGKDIYTVDPSNPLKFTSTDSKLLALGAAVVGSTTACTSATLLLDENGGGMYGFSLGTHKLYYGFSEMGTASNATLEAFISSPTDKVAPTAFSATALADLGTNIMGSEANKLPFPSFATYTFSAKYSSTYGSFDMAELKPAADAATTYGNQLVAAGWTLDTKNSKQGATEAEKDLYIYTLPVAGDDDHIYELSMNYYSITAVPASYASTYPYGYLSVSVEKIVKPAEVVTTLAEVNNLISTLMVEGTNSFPTIDANAKLIAVDGSDQSANMAAISASFVSCVYFHGYCASKADAVEVADEYLAKLLALNFEFDMQEEPTSFADTFETIDEDGAAIPEEDQIALIDMYLDLNDDGTRYFYYETFIQFYEDRDASEGQWVIWTAFELYDENLE